MNASLQWLIIITDGGREIGDAIIATGWDVLSRLAAIRNAIPAEWQAEAYPQIQKGF